MNRCKLCRYHNKQLECCEYLIITKQKRPCPPGDKCTVGARAILKDVCVLAVCGIALVGVAVCYVLPVVFAIVRNSWLALLS